MPVARRFAIFALGLCLATLIAPLSMRNWRRLVISAHAAQNQTADAVPQEAQKQLAPPNPFGQASGNKPTFASLAERAAREGTVRVIVGLEMDSQPEARLSATAITSQRSLIAQSQAALLSRLPPQSLKGVKEYSFIPYIALEVDANGLEQLRTAPEQRTIEEDGMRYTSLAESVPLIGAPNAWAAGFSGSGQTVAILDTGVSKTHSFLTGKVVSEACYSTSSSQTSSVCPGGGGQSTAVGSGVNCGLGGCDHGTHVAGIAAGTSVAFSGVAKDANIVSIQVFSGVKGCSGSNCVTAFDSDILLGMQRVQQLNGSLNIAAVNLSLGGSGSGRTCDATESAFKAGVDSLRALGIATVVASGNNGSNGGMSFPACVSSTISVGSTGDGSSGSITDVVSSYSNSASFLNLLAPGEMINSSIPGNTFAIFRGTSMAAPHVTGAWAVLKSKTPGASVAQVLLALTNTGVPITDPRNGFTKPRIQIDTAVSSLPSGVCNYSISPGSLSVGQSGGGGTIDVTADAGCAWNALSNVPWLTINGAGSGIGNGSVSFTAGANLGVEREGTLLVAGQKYILSQTGMTLFSVDDGSFENASGLQLGGTSYRVNRLTPSAYPATISAVAIYFPGYTGVPLGSSFNITYAAHPSGASNIDGTVFTAASATVQVLDQFNIYPIPALTINSGDFIVGMQFSNAAGVLPFAIDTNPPSQGRSYRSTNGSSFVVIDTIGTPGNYGIRAIASEAVICPIVSNITPSIGLVGSNVAIIGSNFTGVTAVKFSNGVSASYTINNDGLITATVPPGSTTGPITLSRIGCSDVQTTSFAVLACPTISGTSSSAGLIGSSLTINGTNLTGVSSVTFSNGIAASFTVDSATQISTTVPVGAITGPIILGKAGCSNVQTATFTLIPCPTIGGFTPGNGLIGSSVVITGSGFTGVTAVRFSNNVSAIFSIDSATQITATVPAGVISGPITITRPGCSEIQTGSFTVIPCPSIGGFSPGNGLIGSSVVITGSGFTGMTAVRFSNNVSATFSIDSATQITATVPVGAVSGPIMTTRPGCSDIQTGSFTVIPCPTIGGFSPGNGLIGNSVVITGSGFTGVTAVRFSNNVSATFSIDSATQITATVPAGAVSGAITITRPGCSDIQTGSFTVIPCPTIGGFSPGNGLIGSSVVITGSGFTGVTAVRFSNNVSATFSIDSATQITATVPAGAVSGAITITRPGCSEIQTGSFTVIPCPTIGGFTPGNGLTGSNVVISGSGFTGVTAVRFSNNVSAIFSIDSATQITATVPPAAVSGPITITRPGCSDIQTGAFTVIPCPSINGFSPGSGAVGTSVVVTGNNLTGVTAVKFNNNASASFTVDSATQITAVVPSNAVTGAITIGRPGCSDVQTASFTVINCPTIAQMNPGSGIVGSSVMLFGVNFDGVTTVKFSNGVSASFTINNPSQITTTVPFGATSGPITISKTGCADAQTTSFTVIPCSYTLSTSVKHFSAKAGTGSLEVTTGSGCAWDASNSLPWVNITSGPGGVGNGTVTFNVAANPGDVRSGIATIAGQSFTIRQGANFVDVPQDDVFYELIGKISAAGITAGCNANGPQYCPGSVVTREQMAAFIERALGNFSPPTPPTQRFVDVPPTNTFYSFIEQMAMQEITLGCSSQGPLYCPTDAVTREQMAAFMIRALGSFSPPTPTAQRFLDVPRSNPFYAFIDQMAIRGITLGCDLNGPLYCPSGIVTRGQMAAFLARAFSL
jgi:predicted small lipoprotein YifL